MRCDEKDKGKKIILFAGVTTAVYFAMKYVLPIVVPFLFGALLAVMLNPTVEKIVRKTGKGRSVVSMLLVSLVLAVVGTFCFFIGRAACMQLAALFQNADVIESGIREIWCDGCSKIESILGVQFGEAEELFVNLRSRARLGFQNNTLPYLLKNSVSYARAAFSFMGIALVSVISAMLILTDYPQIVKVLGQSEAGRLVSRVKRHAQEAGGTYLKAQVMILAVISVICVIGLFLTGNPYALLAGMGIGLCDALPFVGTGTIFVPWMIIDLVNGKYVMAAVYAVLYVVCSFVRQILEPRLIGGRLGYPPIVVLMSIYIGVHVYGVSGVFLGPVSAFLIWELYAAGVSVLSCNA